jgi:hypothetical protein
MADAKAEQDELERRKDKLINELGRSRSDQRRLASFNYRAAASMRVAAIASSVVAALLAFVPILTIEKWQVGLIAKGNWHYRLARRIHALERRLTFELPMPPTAEQLAAISQSWSSIEDDMTREWEEMQWEPESHRRREEAENRSNGVSNPRAEQRSPAFFFWARK